MKLDEAKQALIDIMTKVLDYEHIKPTGHEPPTASQQFRPKKAWLDADPLRRDTKLKDVDPRRVISVGISLAPKGKPNDYGILILCQRKSDMAGSLVARARTYASKVEVVFTGPVRLAAAKKKRKTVREKKAHTKKTASKKKKKTAKPATEQPPAPPPPPPAKTLRIGESVKRVDRTPHGTLGCFVDVAGSPDVFILSNNHVLAKFDKGVVGDIIKSPKNGTKTKDKVALLDRVHPILFGVNTNKADAALAKLLPGININRTTVDGIGAGGGPEQISRRAALEPEITQRVRKRGAETDATVGEVWGGFIAGGVWDEDAYDTWFAASNQVVIYGVPEDQYEVPYFSWYGDSGSVAFNDSMDALAMIFAVSPYGGKLGGGLTYANPMKQVLDLLGASL